MTPQNSFSYQQPSSSPISPEPVGFDAKSVLRRAIPEHAHARSLVTQASFPEGESALTADQLLLDLRSTARTLAVVPSAWTVRALPTETSAYLVGKRIFDLVLGILILPVVALVGALIASLILLTSGGPVFFRHTRIGRHGRRFKIIKFRTMHPRANEILRDYLKAHPEARSEWSLAHKLRDDPRVTVLGRYLRKTSLDELPQLLNVLRGEMSFVGPRPIVDAECSKYAGRLVYYHAVLPGITGLWQVSGRSDVSYDARVALDERYARDWNMGLDLAILVKTPKAVFHGRGAY